MIKAYTINDAAEVLGVHPDTLRAWHKLGVLPIYETEGGTAIFSPSQLQTLEGIMKRYGNAGVRIGLALEETEVR